MSKQIFARAKATASRALKKYGVSMTLTTPTGEVKGYGVMTDSNTDDEGDTSQSDNSKVIYFQGTDRVKPGLGDIMTVGEASWGVIEVKDYNPDGALTIAYKLKVMQ